MSKAIYSLFIIVCGRREAIAEKIERMGVVDLLLVASMPVMKVLIVTGVGSFLALDRFDIFGETVRKNLNTVSICFFFLDLSPSSLIKLSILSHN